MVLYYRDRIAMRNSRLLKLRCYKKRFICFCASCCITATEQIFQILFGQQIAQKARNTTSTPTCQPVSHDITKANREFGDNGPSAVLAHRQLTLTPYTCLAPALAANMERMPVPLPTSSTILSLKTCLLWYMAFL